MAPEAPKRPTGVLTGGLVQVWRYSMSQEFPISCVWRMWSRTNRAERLIRLPFRSARLLIQRAFACTVLRRKAKINSCILGTVSLSQQRLRAGAHETRSLEHLESVNQPGQWWMRLIRLRDRCTSGSGAHMDADLKHLNRETHLRTLIIYT